MDEESVISFVNIGSLNKESKLVNVVGRIYNFSKIVEFTKKDGNKGRVVNVFLSDGTGLIRLVLWDRQVAIVEEGNIKVGDVIQIVNGIVRESLFDSELEIVPGRYTSINLVENGNYNIPTLEEIYKKFLIPYIPRSEIKNLSPGIFEIFGTVVKIIKGKYVFYSCPICGCKMISEGNVMKCIDHGEMEGQPVMVINVVLDDGTDNIRVVLFRNVAEKILNINANKFVLMSDEEKYNLIKESLLGKDYIVAGKVRKNENFDRIELIASDIKSLNPLEESKKLLEDIEKVVVG